ncbi:unnamed protein product [Danaus chrysippus]|uniref:(African queen) hypothetical protein n=1 Tax=Danaus chrysippus TaxID=151541 RepID=A0A8J2QVP0_9NEOP|nr:unnamed protein product [Danaus chrysippus]
MAEPYRNYIRHVSVGEVSRDTDCRRDRALRSRGLNWRLTTETRDRGQGDLRRRRRRGGTENNTVMMFINDTDICGLASGDDLWPLNSPQISAVDD